MDNIKQIVKSILKESYEPKDNDYKYEASLHINADSDDVAFIGKVYANSIKELKEKSRQHAIQWGHRGRIHVEEYNNNLEFYVNA